MNDIACFLRKGMKRRGTNRKDRWTDQENLELARMYSEGIRNKDIAKKLGRSHGAIKVQLTNLKKKYLCSASENIDTVVLVDKVIPYSKYLDIVQQKRKENPYGGFHQRKLGNLYSLLKSGERDEKILVVRSGYSLPSVRKWTKELLVLK